MNARLIVTAALSLGVAFATAVAAQEQSSPNPKTVALLPVTMTKCTDGARKATKDYLESVITKAGFEIMPVARAVAAARNEGVTTPDEEQFKDLPPLPAPKQLLSIGQKLGCDFVIAARATWHTRSIWVSLGPKTKSDCTVDLLIVDVKKQEVALDAKAVRMDSTAKEDALKAAGTVLLTPLFTAVSGGPKTPHETRAGVLAMAKAISPWLPVSQATKKIK
jgi:hypothetical protein